MHAQTGAVHSTFRINLRLQSAGLRAGTETWEVKLDSASLLFLSESWRVLVIPNGDMS